MTDLQRAEYKIIEWRLVPSNELRANRNPAQPSRMAAKLEITCSSCGHVWRARKHPNLATKGWLGRAGGWYAECPRCNDGCTGDWRPDEW